MKMAQGYITEDGTFFESKLEAELFEAELKLRGRFATLNLRVSADEFLAIVLEIMPQLKGYIDAYEATYTAARNQQAEDEKRKQDEDSAERPRLWKVEATSVVQKQTLHPFSNSRLEDLAMCPTWGVVHLQKRYPNAARSMALEAGRVDASGVCCREDMAA